MSGVFYPNCRAVLSVILDGFGAADSEPLIVPVNPVAATVHRRPYQVADSWSVTFDAADFPIMPASIRTGACELYFYQTDGFEPTPRRGINLRIPVISAGLTRKPTSVGLFDETSVSYSESERTFSIDGQDYVALFAGKDWPKNRRVKPMPLPLAFETLIREVDDRNILMLDFQVPSPSVASGLSLPVIPWVGRNESRTVTKRGLPLKASNYWEAMTALATRYGFIVYMDALTVVVTTPRAALTSADPRLRRMVWGKNITALEISRRMGKERTPKIRVRCWDEVNQRVVTAEFPTRENKARTGVGTLRDEIQTYTVRGMSDPDTLRRAAEAIYDIRARGEQSVVMRTDDLKDVDAKDLLDIRAGDPLYLNFDPYGREHVLALKDIGQRASYLRSRGIRANVAQALARNTSALVAFQKPFRAQEASLEWDVDSGIGIEVPLQEFVALGQGAA